MKSLSYKASRHLWAARLVLVAGHVLLTLLGIFVGKSLALLQVTLPFYLIYLLILPFAAAWLLHPGGHSGHTYALRKWCEGTAGAISFLLVVCLANQRQPVLGHAASAWSNTAVEYGIPKQKLEQPSVDKKPLLQKKSVRQQLRSLRRAYRQGPIGTRIALILLAVAGAFVLLYALALLSCSIACAGAEVLAFIVAILGTGAIAFFFVRAIKAISRRYRREMEQEAPRIKPLPDS
ncbi:hypothetical protein [Pseudocnuella soli]|uniref:hypothetical protein n=1 Tax=Pseudocnuella soli TaxID=2502779 RepID=UPI001050B192|nr:hypothetical protein [Pseudocnuella soli]